MRIAAVLAIALCAGPAAAARRLSLHIGCDVVASARLSVTSAPGALALASDSHGSRALAVFIEQRSGTPVRLRDGSLLPREGREPLVLSGPVERRLRFVPSHGPAELVVTLFPDGAPPRLRN
ncbi:MAG TPA: hypothetical protein VE620_10680 [Myxococcales bacterium]|jgi:hypothetical protein|nr:hypothetical protein [Myxococcales bacterium]